MAKASVSLKSRVEALGYKLFETPDGEQLVLDGTELIFIHCDDNKDDPLELWVAQWEADRGAHVKTKRLEHRLRAAAERVCGAFDKLEYSLPVEASRAIDDLATALDIAKDTAEVEATRPKPEAEGLGIKNDIETLIYDNLSLAAVLGEATHFETDIAEDIGRVAYIIERNTRQIQELMGELGGAS